MPIPVDRVVASLLGRVPDAFLDEDLREAEEEGLLASTGRRFGATWQDITGRAKVRRSRLNSTVLD